MPKTIMRRLVAVRILGAGDKHLVVNVNFDADGKVIQTSAEVCDGNSVFFNLSVRLDGAIVQRVKSGDWDNMFMITTASERVLTKVGDPDEQFRYGNDMLTVAKQLSEEGKLSEFPVLLNKME